jgi:DNA polymerase III subunit delta'
MQFKEVIGHQHIKQQLIRTAADGRVSHAQLFLGPSGSGNLAIALAYAQYISCKNPTVDDSCAVCSSCIKYNKLIHPDLHFAFPLALSKEIRVSSDVMTIWRQAFLDNPYITPFAWSELLQAENKQATIGVDESTEILRKLSLTNFEAPYKILIIWQADKMNLAAANKLLKILEEPPDKTLFILVCENEETLLRTIVSRTQIVKIPKIKEEDILNHLTQEQQLSSQEAQKIAHLADGDFAEALVLLTQNEHQSQNLQNFQKLMRASIKFNVREMMAWVDDTNASGRERQKNFLLYALHLIRQSLMINFGDNTLAKLTTEEQEFIKRFAPFIHSANAERFIDELNKAHYHIERNANAKILFMDVAIKFNELLNLKDTAPMPNALKN